ncbi:3-oxoacyl-ACP synthase [Altibacter sp.]|uniref:3-oxoacyl-ACP synthase n=1 Tax=Altibacter sp. TaxID=2024823 RepID=UPI000C8BDB2E|nr:3-oxoacyl-ACP synthase [Altibacter sp.]MAP55711.1 3-oxoacyl-ACP synthase [Altibacter sp.]|tara:strand:- start:30 stop:488 length:459 start_codon:yes stop_codon:yes gene_type:complete
MTVIELKSALKDQCALVVEKRFQKIKQSIADIEESLLEESKNSSGDKHETGRAMLQIDRENAGKQLQEIENLQSLVKKIDVKATSDYARLGSLVYTNHGTFFISISKGATVVNELTYFCVALHSPIGNFLSGKRIKDSFTFNEKEYTISSIQ